MNEYEGLSLPELLELMHGIVLPGQVPRMPEGPGWWVLGTWLVVVLGMLARAAILYRRRNRYRYEAAAMIDAIAAGADTDPAAAAADSVARSPLFVSPGSRKWTWSSIMPGMRNFPAASMTAMPSSAAMLPATLLIRSPSTRTSASRTVPSLIRRALVISSLLNRVVTSGGDPISPDEPHYGMPGE